MRQVTAATQSALENWGVTTDQINLADLYTFTLITGEVFRYSASQFQVVAPYPNTDTPTFTFALGPRFNRTKSKTVIGLEVDELDLDVIAGPDDLLGTLTWQQCVYYGLFDGATVELDRCVLTYPNTVIGTVNWFYGRIGSIDSGRTLIKMKVNSLLDLLTVQMPKRLFQAACNFHFGDTMCGYDRVNGKNALGVATGIGQQAVTAQTGSDNTKIVTTFNPTPPTAYDQGTIISTSGSNNGSSRTIGTMGGGNTVYFLKPFLYSVSVGDTFNLLPGCDKSHTTCNSTFNNNSRFAGFDHIPPPELAI